MSRFSEHFANERNKTANAPEPKLPKKEREAQDMMREMKRRQSVDNKFRKLLGSGRGKR